MECLQLEFPQIKTVKFLVGPLQSLHLLSLNKTVIRCILWARNWGIWLTRWRKKSKYYFTTSINVWWRNMKNTSINILYLFFQVSWSPFFFRNLVSISHHLAELSFDYYVCISPNFNYIHIVLFIAMQAGNMWFCHMQKESWSHLENNYASPL